MANAVVQKAKLIIGDPVIRMRLLFILAGLAAFRLLAAIPIPGVDEARLQAFFANNQFFGLLSVFSGGGFSTLSLVMLGVGPYITASIIMQLSTVLFPQVKRMYTEEGEAGRTKFISIARTLTIPLAILQGVALIIFAGIISGVPSGISQILFTATAASIPGLVAFSVLAIAAIYAVVTVSEAERSIPIAYARQVRGAASASGAATYLPIRVLQAGVIPIIFALSLLLLPQMILTGLTAVGVGGLAGVASAYASFSANPWAHGAVYFVLVVMFTYFYTSITFEPHRVAENLQKSGAFVPGVRPGRETEAYVGSVVNRITLPGALFLATIAVIPFIVQGLTGITAVLIGGTALLIAVTVLLDLIRKIDAQTCS